MGSHSDGFGAEERRQFAYDLVVFPDLLLHLNIMVLYFAEGRLHGVEDAGVIVLLTILITVLRVSLLILRALAPLILMFFVQSPRQPLAVVCVNYFDIASFHFNKLLHQPPLLLVINQIHGLDDHPTRFMAGHALLSGRNSA